MTPAPHPPVVKAFGENRESDVTKLRHQPAGGKALYLRGVHQPVARLALAFLLVVGQQGFAGMGDADRPRVSGRLAEHGRDVVGGVVVVDAKEDPA